MSEAIITVENLTKLYVLGHQQSKDDGLRHVIEEAMRHPLRWLRGRNLARRKERDEFLAIKDLSFEVKRGDVLGVIGRNGAGKSTLLKILSRITEPTSGRITIDGRVASLLEVGTGFHPELTGRENIYLNGAILGMSRVEIKRKFDEIVAFSEVERFLDTPVKRYSSGMYVRLAFAVAAHLEPEILIVDEVLAVGDTQFQKKCMGKMGEISSKEGRTILFVSHNMTAVSNLCTHGLFLSNGTKVYSGKVHDTIESYLAQGNKPSGTIFWDDDTAPQTSSVRLLAVKLKSGDIYTAKPTIDLPILLEIDYEVRTPGIKISTHIHLLHSQAGELFSSGNFPSATTGSDEWAGKSYPTGRYQSTCEIPANFLNEGNYRVNVAFMIGNTVVDLWERDVLQFSTHDTGNMRKEYTGHWLGAVRPRLNWETQLKSS